MGDVASRRTAVLIMPRPSAKLAVFALLLALLSAGTAQNSTATNLEGVLDEMDQASLGFRSAEADFVWEQYQRVVDETDVQKGKVYFQRQSRDLNMAATITVPDAKHLIYAGGKLSFYQPRIDQVTEYDASRNRAEVESFLVLGFGGRGHDLLSSFAVKLLGFETLDGVRVARLELIPKSDKIRNTFQRILLWVDPVRNVSLKQQFFEPSGDFRTATYSNFRMNRRIPDSAFKLKTGPKTRFQRP